MSGVERWLLNAWVGTFNSTTFCFLLRTMETMRAARATRDYLEGLMILKVTNWDLNKNIAIDRVSDFLRAKHACPHISTFCLPWISFCCIFVYQGYMIRIIFYTDAQLWLMISSCKRQTRSCDMTEYSCMIPQEISPSSNSSPGSPLVVLETLVLAEQLSDMSTPDTGSVDLTVHLSCFYSHFSHSSTCT